MYIHTHIYNICRAIAVHFFFLMQSIEIYTLKIMNCSAASLPSGALAG